MIFIYGFTTWLQNFPNFCSTPYNSLILSQTLQTTSINFSLHKPCPVLSQAANLIIKAKKNQPPPFTSPEIRNYLKNGTEQFHAQEGL